MSKTYTEADARDWQRTMTEKDAAIDALVQALDQVKLMAAWTHDKSTTTGQMIAHARRLASNAR